MDIEEFFESLGELDLTDDQRQFIEAYDDGAQRGAAFKLEAAEERLEELEGRLAALGDDPEKVMADLDSARKQLASRERADAIRKLRTFKVVSAVSERMVERELNEYFAHIKTADLPERGPEIIQQFINDNKGLVIDESGHGSGINTPHVSTGASQRKESDPNNMTKDELNKYVDSL